MIEQRWREIDRISIKSVKALPAHVEFGLTAIQEGDQRPADTLGQAGSVGGIKKLTSNGSFARWPYLRLAFHKGI
jgi:hypothetical protein